MREEFLTLREREKMERNKRNLYEINFNKGKGKSISLRREKKNKTKNIVAEQVNIKKKRLNKK